jgi:hypothetical protein
MIRIFACALAATLTSLTIGSYLPRAVNITIGVLIFLILLLVTAINPDPREW